MNSKSVIIVGAGASGLTAAYRLQQAGFEPVVLEASDRIGGRVQSLHKDGYILDLGADANTSGYKTYLALTKELGLENAITKIGTEIGTVISGKVRYMDIASKWSMASTSAYSLRAKFKILQGIKSIAPDMAGVDAANFHLSATLDDPDRTAESYGLRHFGVEAYDYMIEPMARLFHTTGGEKTSLLDVVTGLALAEAEVWTFLGGANVLLKAMAEKLNIRFHCAVEHVEETGDGVSVTYRDAEGKSISEQYAACVLAILYEDILNIHPPIKALSPELHQNLSYMQTNKIHVGYKAPTRSKAFTIQMPTCEGDDFFLMFLDHNKAPDRAPPGHSLLNLQTDSKFFEKSMTMSDEELVSLARRTIEKYLPELAGHYSGMSNVARWPRLGNLNYPGYYRNVMRFVERLDTRSRIQIAGDVFSKASQENAAFRGEWAANNIKNFLSPRTGSAG